MSKTFESLMDAYEAKLDALCDEAMYNTAVEIYCHFLFLEERFPRHKFEMVDGMGTTSITVYPPIFGDNQLYSEIQMKTWYPSGRFKKTLGFLWEHINACTDACVRLDELFRNATVGVVNTDKHPSKD